MLYVNTLNAGRTIYHGYKNAFIDLAHEFYTVTADDDFARTLDKVCPDIFMTGLGHYNLRYMDLLALKKHRLRGMKVFVNMPFWTSPIKRVNESASLKNDDLLVNLIKNDKLGDFYYNVCEPDDPRMEGFEQATGYSHITIPLAADKLTLKGQYLQKYNADISFIGTYLPEKRPFFKRIIFPLQSKYRLRLYGQDWTLWDRVLGIVQKCGQYYNFPILKDIRKLRMNLGDEANIYASSIISINVHEEYQRRFGGDCNERTFKIPLCNGFEITDDVRCIRKYFQEGDEIIIAKDDRDFLEKLEYYLRNPEQRKKIVQRGSDRVLSEHTYHNRIAELLNLL